jgi:glycerol-3-phosphate dehydrogenase
MLPAESPAVSRRLDGVVGRKVDLVVVGGGIHGASACWEATSRGLSVILLEAGDFACGTSANSLKIIHGGIRHLPGARLDEVRRSVRERRALLRIAPHLVRPLPCLALARGPAERLAMGAAALAYDALAADRNAGLDPARRLGASRIVPPAEVEALVPGLAAGGGPPGCVAWPRAAAMAPWPGGTPRRATPSAWCWPSSCRRAGAVP